MLTLRALRLDYRDDGLRLALVLSAEPRDAAQLARGLGAALAPILTPPPAIDLSFERAQREKGS
jgi:hypothetical protein